MNDTENEDDFFNFLKGNHNMIKKLKICKSEQNVFDAIMWHSIHSRYADVESCGVRDNYKIVSLPEETHGTDDFFEIINVSLKKRD